MPTATNYRAECPGSSTVLLINTGNNDNLHDILHNLTPKHCKSNSAIIRLLCKVDSFMGQCYRAHIIQSRLIFSVFITTTHYTTTVRKEMMEKRKKKGVEML